MQSDRFIDTFYRPFLHEKLSLRLSCKNFSAVTDWKRFVTTYCMKLIYISSSFLTIFINRLDTVYYPCVTCTLILFLLDLVEILLKLFYKNT